MTTEQAARELGISAIRIRHLIASGKLRARKVGDQWHITPGALDKVRVRPVGRPAKEKMA